MYLILVGGYLNKQYMCLMIENVSMHSLINCILMVIRAFEVVILDSSETCSVIYTYCLKQSYTNSTKYKLQIHM